MSTTNRQVLLFIGLEDIEDIQADTDRALWKAVS
jgi:O-acetylhomoserine/O-acetylserine sulfhydrylase-like pyridoxal-dependent enzyme